jgi:hypothetical protein
MKKQYTRLVVAGWLLAISLNFNSNLMAEGAAVPAEAAAKPGAVAKSSEGRKLPFHGKLSSVSTDQKTITLVYSTGEKTYHLTPDTLILKNDQPSTLVEAEVGKQVSGAYIKQGDRMELTKLNLTQRLDSSEDKPRKAKKEARKTKEPTVGKTDGN